MKNNTENIKICNKVILGSFSQSSPILTGIGIGLQCVPNSVISLIYNHHKLCSLWNTDDLDNILKCGNILYNSIGKTTTLLVTEIPKYIKLYETIYFVQYLNSVIGYIFKDNYDITSVKFSKLFEIFSKFKYFVLILNDSCVSIINIKNVFWVFDPHSRDKEGFPSSSGTSILLQFPNFFDLCHYIEKFAIKANCEMYELTPISITKFKEIKEIQKYQTNNKNCEYETITKKRKSTDEITIGSKKQKTNKVEMNHEILKDNELAKKLGYNLQTVKIILNKVETSDSLKTNILHEEKKNNCFCNSNILNDELLAKQKGYKLPILNINLQKKVIKSERNENAKNETINLTKKLKENYGKNIEGSIQIFNKLTTVGPIYVCTICQQINFLHNLSKISNLKKKNNKLLEECNTHYKSIDKTEYICHVCKRYIYKNKIPKLSIKNGCGFYEKPEILNLFCLEERFISPVMAFMLIHQLFPGGQFSLSGGICHLPIEIGKIIKTLPCRYSEFETIAVKLKRRLCYKNSVWNENVRPYKIIEALKYLLTTSELYKEHNINIDYEWLKSFNNINSNTISKEVEMESNTNTPNSSSDEDSDCEETPNAPSVNTLLTEKTQDPNSDILCIAPAEGQKPIFTDEDTEYLCFPTIFCGKRRKPNKYHNLTKREIFKYELRSCDTRVSTNIPNIFWKTKYKQIQQIHQQVNFALRRNQTKGKKITAQTLLNKESRENIVKLDDGYQIFKNIRNSPPYFENKKKNLMAMIRQLGIPTLFISLSAADTKWINLLSSIKTLLTNKLCTDEEIEQMTWSEKCSLISTHPTICSQYFDNRVKKFYKHILKSPHSPFGKLINYFYRVEFQHRGSPHIHGLLWIENVPHYENNTDEEIVEYIDSIISCSRNSYDCEHKSVELQLHKHSKSCIKKINNTKKCRFGAPWPPMKETKILYPLDEHHIKKKEFYSEIFKKVNKFIQTKYKEKEFMSFEVILTNLNISYETYILAIRSTIKKRKIFLKRTLKEIYINNYMKHFVHVWNANHDIQYVLDPYSCVVYICDYLTKNNKGMSKLLEQAAKEARQGNMDLKKSVRHIGNKFLNCTEMSEQECVYSLLELPITQSSIKIEFINTSEIQNRVFIAKPENLLKKMDPDDDNIKQPNNIDKYAYRPKQLNHMCLADFVSMTDITQIYKPISFEDEESIDEHSSEEENEIEQNDIRHLFPIKLRNNKILKLRKKRKIIRFVNYKYKIDPENYCREKLLLYIPWIESELNILQNFTNYIEAYNFNRQDIHNKMKMYEPAAEIIEHAFIEYDSDPQKYFPTEVDIEDNNNIIPTEIDTNENIYNILHPQENEQYDIGSDLQIRNYNYVNSIQTNPNIVDNSAYMELINSLNEKQHNFFSYIMQETLQNEKQILTCLHGGAGTGKSHVLKALYQGLYRLLNKNPGEQTNNLITLLTAPTGKAAYNIKGYTIHCAFHIPANQSLSTYNKLSWDTLNTLRSKYINLKWIIFDEISMVSNNMLKYINFRLQEIKSNSLLFGGINIIAVGDFYQLKPVKGQFIFEDYKDNYGPLAINLWTENFTIFELTEIMRQKDDKNFAQLLNRLRTGAHTKKDIQFLKDTKIHNRHLANNTTIPHFFPTKEQVKLYNSQIINNTNFTIESKSLDILPSSISKILENNIHIAISKRQEHNTGGLPDLITLNTEQQYDIISNIDVTDGLINGTECCIKYIETKKNQDENVLPITVWVQFENDEIGKKQRQNNSHLYINKKINHNWTPINKIKRSFLVKDIWIHRIQFPLRQAAARTIHVSQSSTYKNIYVDLETYSKPPKIWWQHMHYVAFSRVTKYTGLYINDVNENQISVSKKVSEYLLDANKNHKLQTNVKLFTRNKLNILFNNARSFKKYFNIIKQNNIIHKQHINIFLESKLCKHDQNKNYIIDESIIVRADQKNSNNPYHGIITYVNKDININRIEYKSKENIDTLILNIKYNTRDITLISLYNAPNNQYSELENHITKIIKEENEINNNIILLGDFNIQICSPHYLQLSQKLLQYNLKQHISNYSTIYKTTIDYIFSNIEVYNIQNIHAHWSDHNMIHLEIN